MLRKQLVTRLSECCLIFPASLIRELIPARPSPNRIPVPEKFGFLLNPHFPVPLLDIPYNCLTEKLVTLVDSVSFIPEQCVPKVRKVFIRSMKAIVASPQDSLVWKKFFLLPTVLLTNQVKDRKAILKATLALIEKDGWSSFTYGSFPKTRLAKLKEDDEKQQSKSAEFREHKIDMLAKAGDRRHREVYSSEP